MGQGRLLVATSFCVHLDQLDELRKRSAESGVPVARMIRGAIDGYLGRSQPGPVPEQCRVTSAEPSGVR